MILKAFWQVGERTKK